MKITGGRSPPTVCIALSVHRSRHRAASAKLSRAPTVTVQPLLLSPLYGVPWPFIKQGDFVLHVWSLQALCLNWANVPHVHACSAQGNSYGALDAQFLATATSQLFLQIPMFRE
jgi:hypothetical protein